MTIKMAPNKKKVWLAALRSGKYNHTPGVLCDGKGGYCCIGVLAEISPSVVKRVDPPRNYGIVEYAGTKDPYDFNHRMLSKDQLEQIGIDFMVARKLAEINDNSLNFDRVIEFIKTNL